MNKKGDSCIENNKVAKKNFSPAFTIIELIVVIVIIGILATITIVSYFGINDKAIESSLKSQLSSASRSLKAFQVEYDNYPTTIDCTIANSSTNLCLKPGDNATYTYQVDNTVGSQSFTLYATSTLNGKIFKITDGSVAEEASGIDETEGWSQITAGYYSNCAIASTNQIYCWGENNYGQLGNNSTTNSLVPVEVDTSGVLSGKTINAISAGNESTCVIASDNKAYCWGRDSTYGQLGNNSKTNSLIPVAVDTSGVLSGKTIKAISTGGNHVCVIASDDQVYCWGCSDNGQLGNNSTTNSSIPVAVDTSGVLSGKTIKAISTIGYHTCVIASDDQAYCWGSNTYGQLGNGSTTNSLVPVAVDTSGVLSGKTIKAISAGYYHTCVIASDDQAYCWGWNNRGQLGNRSTTTSKIPVAVNTSGVLNSKDIKSVSAGCYHTCAIASDDQVYCWGNNSSGQLGNNSTVDSSVPVAVDTSDVLNGKTNKIIAAGNSHNCAIASDGYIYCWGYNGYGQLGNNSTTKSLVPVKIVSSES